jgi:ferredoxin-nitrite reductase
VLIGGGSDERQGLGRELTAAIRFADLPLLMEKLFRCFLRMRMEHESFLDFTRRHPIEQLKELLTVEEQA